MTPKPVVRKAGIDAEDFHGFAMDGLSSQNTQNLVSIRIAPLQPETSSGCNNVQGGCKGGAIRRYCEHLQRRNAPDTDS